MNWDLTLVRFDLGPLLQGQTRIAKVKVLITRLLLVQDVWEGKPTYRKSYVRNLLVWSDLTLDPSFKSNDNGWESSDVRFDLWQILQDQTMVHWLW